MINEEGFPPGESTKATVTFRAKYLDETTRYLVWGYVTLNDDSSVYSDYEHLLFGARPITFNASSSVAESDYEYKRNLGSLIPPSSIQKIDNIIWRAIRIDENGDPVGDYIVLDEINDEMTIYVLPRKPIEPQANPRTDLLNIVCKVMEGRPVNDTQQMKNELFVGLWNWLDQNLKYNPFEYDITHIFWDNNFNKYNCNFRFNLHQFLKDGGGDCEDASAFYQISCNALGIPMYTRTINIKPGIYPACYSTNNLRAFGERPVDHYDVYGTPIHMVACTQDGEKVWDPTFCFESSPNLVYDYNKEVYKYKAINPDDINSVEWHPVIRCVEVRNDLE